jgi:hypothetical protein
MGLKGSSDASVSGAEVNEATMAEVLEQAPQELLDTYRRRGKQLRFAPDRRALVLTLLLLWCPAWQCFSSFGNNGLCGIPSAAQGFDKAYEVAAGLGAWPAVNQASSR